MGGSILGVVFKTRLSSSGGYVHAHAAWAMVWGVISWQNVHVLIGGR
jgi:hypothetical protein